MGTMQDIIRVSVVAVECSSRVFRAAAYFVVITANFTTTIQKIYIYIYIVWIERNSQ